MTTFPSDDESEKLPKKTSPLSGRNTTPTEDEPAQEAPESEVDPLEELRQRLQSEDQNRNSSKNDIFSRMTESLSNRKIPQRPKDENNSENIFGVRTAGNAPFTPEDRQESQSDHTRDTVILQSGPKLDPFLQDESGGKSADLGEGHNQSGIIDEDENASDSKVSRVRPIDPEEQEAAWRNYPKDELDDQRPSLSILDEKLSQSQGDRKRLPSGFDRQKQVSRYISYNPKRSTWAQFKELSNIEKTLIIALAIAVIGLVSLIAYLFIMSRQPGFGSSNNSLIAEPTPIPSVGPPVPVGLRLTGGWHFDLASGVMVDGVWNPTKSEWLVDTEIRRVVALPWNKQIEAVVQSFDPGDLIELEMSNGDSFAYKVLTVSEVPVGDTSILYDIRPTLAIILIKPEAEKRWVVVAEPQ